MVFCSASSSMQLYQLQISYTAVNKYPFIKLPHYFPWSK